MVPATTSEPLVGALFGAAANVTVPLPLPLAPDAIVIQPVPVVAVHGQPVGDVTFTLAVPPFSVKRNDVGETLYVHAVGAAVAAACVTVTDWPPRVSVPVRVLVVAFEATL